MTATKPTPAEQAKQHSEALDREAVRLIGVTQPIVVARSVEVSRGV